MLQHEGHLTVAATRRQWQGSAMENHPTLHKSSGQGIAPSYSAIQLPIRTRHSHRLWLRREARQSHSCRILYVICTLQA